MSAMLPTYTTRFVMYGNSMCRPWNTVPSIDLYKYILHSVPPIHVVRNHVATDKLTTANGGTFASNSLAQPVLVANNVKPRLSLIEWYVTWLATESSWAWSKCSAICSGKLYGGFIIFGQCCPCSAKWVTKYSLSSHSMFNCPSGDKYLQAINCRYLIYLTDWSIRSVEAETLTFWRRLHGSWHNDACYLSYQLRSMTNHFALLLTTAFLKTVTTSNF